MDPWPALAPYGKSLAMPGGELFYYDSGGDGRPVVALVHGLGDEADTWRHVFPLLTEAGYRVIAPDLPGFGRSLWKGRINTRIHCNALIRLLTETCTSKGCPAVLAGSSLGSSIAELAAGKRPDLVKALILIGGCVPFAGRVERGMLLMGLPFLGRGWYRGFRKNHEAAWKSLYPYYNDLDAMGVEDKDFLRDRVIARVESPRQERGYFATLRSLNAFLLFGQQAAARKIKAFTGKILLLWGEQDRIVPQEKAAILRSLRPDADFVLLPGAGHLPHQEKPTACAAQMLRFLQEILSS